MNLRIEAEPEVDGRSLTESLELSVVMAYGQTRREAIARLKALGSRVMAARLEHEESDLELGPLARRCQTLDYFHDH